VHCCSCALVGFARTAPFSGPLVLLCQPHLELQCWDSGGERGCCDMQGGKGTGKHMSSDRGTEIGCSVDLWPRPATGVCMLCPPKTCYFHQCICTMWYMSYMLCYAWWQIVQHCMLALAVKLARPGVLHDDVISFSFSFYTLQFGCDSSDILDTSWLASTGVCSRSAALWLLRLRHVRSHLGMHLQTLDLSGVCSVMQPASQIMLWQVHSWRWMLRCILSLQSSLSCATL